MSTEELKSQLQNDGAILDEAGRVTHFGDRANEYAAANDSLAMFDLSERSHIQLRGEDRQKFLHNFCTNEIKGLESDNGCEAFVCNDKGRVLAHTYVFAENDSLWIESVNGASDVIAPHLDRYLITEDVEIIDQSSSVGQIFVSGPSAGVTLETAGLPVDALAELDHKRLELDGLAVSIRRCDLLGQQGFSFVTDRENLAKLWLRLRELGIQPAGRDVFELSRIEACMPQFGQDISDANLAQEVDRTESAICFTKGCYLGQEPIARIDALGHVNRELRGVHFKISGDTPEVGSVLVAGDDDKEVGQLTSVASSIDQQSCVGLAYIRRGFNGPDSEVRVQLSSGELLGKVFVAKRDEE